MNQQEILNHINDYASSGNIHDDLIRYYDQDGCWRGDLIKWQIPIRDEALEAIRKSRLPESRIMAPTDHEPVLRTSFYWHSSTPVTLIYTEVQGSVVVTANAFVYAPILSLVGGHCILKTDRQIYVPSLHNVGGDFLAMRGFLLLAQRLSRVGGNMMIAGYVPPNIETVGGRLAAYWIDELEILALKHVGGSLSAPKAISLAAPKLETVGGNLLINAARRLSAPLLTSIDGDFIATSATSISARCLLHVGGDMDTRAAKGYYHPSNKVNGGWTMYPGALESWVAAEHAKEILRATSKTIYL